MLRSLDAFLNTLGVLGATIALAILSAMLIARMSPAPSEAALELPLLTQSGDGASYPPVVKSL